MVPAGNYISSSYRLCHSWPNCTIHFSLLFLYILVQICTILVALHWPHWELKQMLFKSVITCCYFLQAAFSHTLFQLASCPTAFPHQIREFIDMSKMKGIICHNFQSLELLSPFLVLKITRLGQTIERFGSGRANRLIYRLTEFVCSFASSLHEPSQDSSFLWLDG